MDLRKFMQLLLPSDATKDNPLLPKVRTCVIGCASCAVFYCAKLFSVLFLLLLLLCVLTFVPIASALICLEASGAAY